MKEMDIVNALIERRVAAGVSGSEVARRLRTSQSVISDLEHGKHGMSVARMVAYAEALGLKVTIKFERI